MTTFDAALQNAANAAIEAATAKGRGTSSRLRAQEAAAIAVAVAWLGRTEGEIGGAIKRLNLPDAALKVLRVQVSNARRVFRAPNLSLSQREAIATEWARGDFAQFTWAETFKKAKREETRSGRMRSLLKAWITKHPHDLTEAIESLPSDCMDALRKMMAQNVQNVQNVQGEAIAA